MSTVGGAERAATCSAATTASRVSARGASTEILEDAKYQKLKLNQRKEFEIIWVKFLVGLDEYTVESV